jgi:putative nucleotidyltransferase with HDIG domain
MNRRTMTYCLTVIAVALAIAGFADWSVLRDIPAQHLSGAAVLVFLAVLSEGLAVSALVGTEKTSSSIAFLPLFAFILLFPLEVALIAAFITTFATQVFVHRKPLIRAGFNTAQVAIAIYVAGLVYYSFGGRNGIPLATDVSTGTGMLCFAALAFTFFFTNQVLVSAVIAFSTGSKITSVFVRMIGSSAGAFLYDLLASPIAVVVALLYTNFYIPGLVMVSLPLLIIRHSYVTNNKLERANRNILTVLVKTIETRDPYTSGHSIRVSLLARAIAEDLDLSPGRVDQIETIGMLHDIGKIDAVYAPIISKEGSLSDSERRIIMTHAEKGAEFLTTLESFSTDVIEGVRHHHERYDGTGYPDGLITTDVPLASRIIMLCDSIDAMLSDRPYRKALSVEQVEKELVRCSGSQFDPKIVDVILSKNTLGRAAALVRPESGAKPQLVKATA